MIFSSLSLLRHATLALGEIEYHNHVVAQLLNGTSIPRLPRRSPLHGPTGSDSQRLGEAQFKLAYFFWTATVRCHHTTELRTPKLALYHKLKQVRPLGWPVTRFAEQVKPLSWSNASSHAAGGGGV